MRPVTAAVRLKDLHLREGILAGRGIEHQKGRMGGIGIELLQHPDDLLELGHQVGLVLQPARGVDDEHVGSLLARRMQRVESEAGGVGAGGPRDEAGADPFRPHGKLLDCRGAKGITGGKRHRETFAAGNGAELADRRRLARNR